jgi:hypothetical protein
MSLTVGLARANSKAQLRPIPEEAPVMRMVFPARRADDMVLALRVAWIVLVRGLMAFVIVRRRRGRNMCGKTRGWRWGIKRDAGTDMVPAASQARMT